MESRTIYSRYLGLIGSEGADIIDSAYSKYQLDWLKNHGFSLKDLADTFSSLLCERIRSDCDKEDMVSLLDNPDMFVYTLIEDFLDKGFNGSLYVCKDEFTGAEFLDESYMESLLNEDEFKRYKEFIHSL